MNASRTATGTAWTYRVNGSVIRQASKADYAFASLTYLTDGDPKPVISLHKSEAAAAKGAGGYFARHTKSVTVLPVETA